MPSIWGKWRSFTLGFTFIQEFSILSASRRFTVHTFTNVGLDKILPSSFFLLGDSLALSPELQTPLLLATHVGIGIK